MWSRMYLLVVFLSIALGVNSRSIDEEFGMPCKFGDRTLQHNEVASAMPEKCVMMVCRNGVIVDEMVGGPMDTGCCMTFNDVMVPNGLKTQHCRPAVCKDSVWVSGQVHPQCCGYCHLHPNSHFVTFDGHYFNWQGNCNYTLVQASDFMDGGAAVFTELDREGSCATNFSHTTFRNDPHTIINITKHSITEIDVNGEMMSIPEEGMHFIKSSKGKNSVLAYRHDQCIVLLGSSLITLRYCPLTLGIGAPKILSGTVSGLCGAFNYDVKDDFTTPAGDVMPLERHPLEYPEAWRAESQTMPMCLEDGVSTSVCNGTKGNKCLAPPHTFMEYTHTCNGFLQSHITQARQLVVYINPCAIDLCLAAQQYTGDKLAQMTKVIFNNYMTFADEHLQYLKMVPVLDDPVTCSDPISITIPVDGDEEHSGSMGSP